MKTRISNPARGGFTLIEVIVTIVIAAVALAAIVPFLGDVFLRSHEPRMQLNAAMDLQSAMEELVAWHTADLQSFHQQVGHEGDLWKGRFVVVENHFVEFTAGGQETESDVPRLLKVTLQNELGESITRLFSVPLGRRGLHWWK